MQAADQALRAGEGGVASPGLDEIRAHGQEVVEDHRRFKEAQTARADGVRPQQFEDVLAGTYELTATPLPEERVEEVTVEAVEALVAEREQAGGIIPAAARVSLQPTDEGTPEGVVEQNATGDRRVIPPQGAHLVDYFALAKELEGRLNALQGAIAGLTVRVEAISRGGQGPKGGAGVQVVPTSGSEQAEARSPVPAGPGRLATLQERREKRRPGPGEAGAGARGVGQGPGDAPGPSPVSSDPTGPTRQAPLGGRTWVPRLKVDRRLIGFGAGALVVLAAALVIGRRSGVTREEQLVELQVQGVGTYVRAEQAELDRLVQREGPLRQEEKRIQGDLERAGSERDRESARRRHQEVLRLLDRVARARSGLRALEDVSGVTAP